MDHYHPTAHRITLWQANRSDRLKAGVPFYARKNRNVTWFGSIRVTTPKILTEFKQKVANVIIYLRRIQLKFTVILYPKIII